MTLPVHCDKGLEVYGVDIDENIIAKVSQGVSPGTEVGVPDLVRKYSLKGRLKISASYPSFLINMKLR